MRIGVDFGGVLTETTAPPKERYLDVPPRENCYEVLHEWQMAGHEPILISKATSAQEVKAREWLRHWHFDEIFIKGMEFCLEQEGKVDICRNYGVEIMVDDTVHQLELLDEVVNHRVLFNTYRAPKGMLPAINWTKVDQIVKSI